jgi:hypothetical protein
MEINALLYLKILATLTPSPHPTSPKRRGEASPSHSPEGDREKQKSEDDII